MSSPKPIQVPPPSHVTFTKTGRAVADLDRLIDRELARVGGQPAAPPAPNKPLQPNGANNQQNQNNNQPK